MTNGLADLINSFEGLSVVVIGDAMLDRYTRGAVDRVCPDAPVPIVRLAEEHNFAGGAANVAVNCRALGARTSLLTVVGDDPEASSLAGLLTAADVSTDWVHMSPQRRTLLKQRILAGSQLIVRLDWGTGDPLDRQTQETCCNQVPAILSEADVVILSDYGYGMLTGRLIDAIARERGRFAGIVAADSKNLRQFARLGPTVVKPNFVQTLSLLESTWNSSCGRGDFVAQHSRQILEITGADIAAVTLDQDGTILCRHGGAPYRTFCRVASPCYPSGAGDSFLATFCLSLAAGGTAAAASELASAAAAVVVRKEQTAVCTRGELTQQIGGGGRTAADRRELAGLLAEERRLGRRIVLTSGCFDIVHRGHIALLQQAKALGDLLVVGINSDESIRRLKGPDRPINSLEDRMAVLAGISCVDYLIPFDEDTPHVLIGTVCPHVFVKGGDYTRERLPEAALVERLGGRVEILPYMAERSTTGIINRICGSQVKENAALTQGK